MISLNLLKECFYILFKIFHCANVPQSGTEYNLYIFWLSEETSKSQASLHHLSLKYNNFNSTITYWALIMFQTIASKGLVFKKNKRRGSISSRSSQLLIFLKGNNQIIWCFLCLWSYMGQNFVLPLFLCFLLYLRIREQRPQTFFPSHLWSPSLTFLDFVSIFQQNINNLQTIFHVSVFIEYNLIPCLHISAEER